MASPEVPRALLCPWRPVGFTSQAEVSVMKLLQSGPAARCYSPGVWDPASAPPGPRHRPRSLGKV